MEKFNVEVGGLSSKKLKKEYSDSYFMRPEFDTAIMGVNPMTGSVIYHLVKMIDITMNDQYGDDIDEDDFDDAYDNCMELVFGEFRNIEYLKSSLVAPTLFEEILKS